MIKISLNILIYIHCIPYDQHQEKYRDYEKSIYINNKTKVDTVYRTVCILYVYCIQNCCYLYDI